jgi:hypothetical protein
MVRRLPTLRWLPSDLSPENIAMIQDDASRNNACTKPSEGGIALHDIHLRLWALARRAYGIALLLATTIFVSVVIINITR